MAQWNKMIKIMIYVFLCGICSLLTACVNTEESKSENIKSENTRHEIDFTKKWTNAVAEPEIEEAESQE